MLKSKIHRAVVTEANLDYIGSITIDEQLMLESGIVEYEKVQVVDINNGNRFETYVIKGEKNSGVICVNGAAARHVLSGDKIIIMAYCQIDQSELESFKPTVIFVDKNNAIKEISHFESPGKIYE